MGPASSYTGSSVVSFVFVCKVLLKISLGISYQPSCLFSTSLYLALQLFPHQTLVYSFSFSPISSLLGPFIWDCLALQEALPAVLRIRTDLDRIRPLRTVRIHLSKIYLVVPKV
jgi:hypothetical protein